MRLLQPYLKPEEESTMSVEDIGVIGWQKNSFIDFPGTVSTVLFFRGCNLRCPYCHNPDIVLNRPGQRQTTGLQPGCQRRKNLIRLAPAGQRHITDAHGTSVLGRMPGSAGRCNRGRRGGCLPPTAPAAPPPEDIFQQKMK